MHELIRYITFCILFAWGLGLLAHFTRQPLILAYLIAGFVIGPFGMGWVKSQDSINVISELGLIFMLFMIGLEIDLKKIVRAGKVILFAAGGQLIGGVLLGILFCVGIGLSMGNGHFDALENVWQKSAFKTLPLLVSSLSSNLCDLRNLWIKLFPRAAGTCGRSESRQ